MVNKSLKNKKIIISAGASGIGLATAKVCLSRGANVYLCDIDNKSLNKLNQKESYEEIDTRLASGWYVDAVDNIKKKKYKTEKVSFKISKKI